MYEHIITIPKNRGFRVTATLPKKSPKRNRRKNRQRDRKKTRERNCRLLNERKRRILGRIVNRPGPERDQPMMTATNIHYELATRDRGVEAMGGIGAMHLARRIGLIDQIDPRCMCSSAICPTTSRITCSTSPTTSWPTARAWRTSNCGATTRSSSTPWARTHSRPDHGRRFLPSLPRPTSGPAGRHQRHAAQGLGRAAGRVLCPGAHRCRRHVVETTGECKQGMDIAYNGTGATIRCWCRWPTPGRCCTWSIAPATGPRTKGPPWNSTGHPRLSPQAASADPAARRHRFHADQAPGPLGRRPGIRFIFGIDATANAAAIGR